MTKTELKLKLNQLSRIIFFTKDYKVKPWTLKLLKPTIYKSTKGKQTGRNKSIIPILDHNRL